MIMMIFTDDMLVCVCVIRSDSMIERCLSPSFPPLLSTNTSLDSTMLAATDLSWLGQLTNSAASPGLYQRGLRINDDHDDDDDDDDDTSFVYSIRWRRWLKFKICKLSQILKCHRILLQKTRIGKIQNCSEFCETETKTAVFLQNRTDTKPKSFFSNRAHL